MILSASAPLTQPRSASLNIRALHRRPSIVFGTMPAASSRSASAWSMRRSPRGPPPTGKGELLGVRLQAPLLSDLDAWIARQDGEMSRPEADPSSANGQGSQLVSVGTHSSTKNNTARTAYRHGGGCSGARQRQICAG